MNPTCDTMPSANVNMNKMMRKGCEPNPLERLPPPAGSNKPLTPFSIADILGKPNQGTRAHLSSPVRMKRRVTCPVNQTSPLCALQELTSKTFRGLELGVLQAAEGKPQPSINDVALDFNENYNNSKKI